MYDWVKKTQDIGDWMDMVQQSLGRDEIYSDYEIECEKNANINHPYFGGLYQPFIEIWGMVETYYFALKCDIQMYRLF